MNEVAERAFRRHYGQVYRFMRRRTGDHDRAEDLAQEVFAVAVAVLPTRERDDDSLLPWLYTVAKRRFADQARARARDRRLQVPLREQPDVANEYGAVVAAAISRGLGRLSEPQRRVVTLKLLRGASFAEIAQVEDVTVPAAKMRFVRALRRCVRS